MLEVVVALVIIALVLLFIRAGRQNTIVYRKKVARPDRGYSIRDDPSVASPGAGSGEHTDHERTTGQSGYEAFAFQGGEFGGGGAGDSYESTAPDFPGNDFNCSEPIGGDISCSDSGTDDAGSNDSGSDASGDCSGPSPD